LFNRNYYDITCFQTSKERKKLSKKQRNKETKKDRKNSKRNKESVGIVEHKYNSAF